MTVAAATIAEDNDAPHNYDHIFIIEKLDEFVENPFDGNFSDLPIPQEVIVQASKLVDEIKEASANPTALILEKNETDQKIKSAISMFVI